MKFGFDWPNGFGEDPLKMVDGLPTTDHGYTISSLMSLQAYVS